jgi:hypothetical protein
MTHVINKNDFENNYNHIGPIVLLTKFSLNNQI